jgi:hypothetical protein
MGNTKENISKLEFDQVMQLINHVASEEMHFNSLELEYRKLTSHWLLASLGAMGYLLSRQNTMMLDIWILIFGIAVVSATGIFILSIMDLKVYHELLHGAYKEGLKLEQVYPEYLPPIRSNMRDSMIGKDIIKRVTYYYFGCICLLAVIANVVAWRFYLTEDSLVIPLTLNVLTIVILSLLRKYLLKNSERNI